MSRTTMYFSLLAAVLLIGALAPAHANNVYRWVDKHGLVHYTDQWRPGATRIVTATGAARDSGSSASSATNSSLSAGDREANRQIQRAANARAVHAAETKLRAQRCTKAKAVYHRLLIARRLFSTGKNGKRHYMSDAQANAVRVKARSLMVQLCGSGAGR